MTFIISIFLLILCIVISQSADYYLHQFSFNMPPSGAEMNGLDRLLCASSMRKGVKKSSIEALTPTPTPIPTQNMPMFIVTYMSNISSNKYLTNSQTNNVYNAVTFAKNVPPVEKRDDLIHYLKLLRIQLKTSDSPQLPQIIYFCISIPCAFELFFLPDDEIPIPYNKLHANMVDIFPTSKPYTQIQIICILWQQTMLLFNPPGPIIDPKDNLFQEIVNSYIDQIINAIDALITFYNSSYTSE